MESEVGVSSDNDFPSGCVICVYVGLACHVEDQLSFHSVSHRSCCLNGKLFHLLSQLSGPSVVYF